MNNLILYSLYILLTLTTLTLFTITMTGLYNLIRGEKIPTGIGGIITNKETTHTPQTITLLHIGDALYPIPQPAHTNYTLLVKLANLHEWKQVTQETYNHTKIGDKW